MKPSQSRSPGLPWRADGGSIDHLELARFGVADCDGYRVELPGMVDGVSPPLRLCSGSRR